MKTSHVSLSKNDVLREPQDFSLVLGGTLFQLLRRSHLSGNALELVQQRILSPLAWLPLLVLSALEGHALGGNVAVPFVYSGEACLSPSAALRINSAEGTPSAPSNEKTGITEWWNHAGVFQTSRVQFR